MRQIAMGGTGEGACALLLVVSPLIADCHLNHKFQISQA